MITKLLILLLLVNTWGNLFPVGFSGLAPNFSVVVNPSYYGNIAIGCFVIH
jgi:hypothetical protein